MSQHAFVWFRKKKWKFTCWKISVLGSFHVRYWFPCSKKNAPKWKWNVVHVLQPNIPQPNIPSSHLVLCVIHSFYVCVFFFRVEQNGDRWCVCLTSSFVRYLLPCTYIRAYPYIYFKHICRKFIGISSNVNECMLWKLFFFCGRRNARNVTEKSMHAVKLYISMAWSMLYIQVICDFHRC